MKHHQHDCNKCFYINSGDNVDYYQCGDNLIIRHSSEPSDSSCFTRDVAIRIALDSMLNGKPSKWWDAMRDIFGRGHVYIAESYPEKGSLKVGAFSTVDNAHKWANNGVIYMSVIDSPDLQKVAAI
jgi:hypothetical protein